MLQAFPVSVIKLTDMISPHPHGQKNFTLLGRLFGITKTSRPGFKSCIA
jgi:hypothetical protein